MPTGQQYGTNVPQTTLTAGILAGTTSFGASSLSGWPATPFTAVLEIGTSTQEPIDVLGVSGNTITSCNRAIDGTTAFAHPINATLTHADIGRDFREARTHIDASTGVHGVTGAVVGTTDAQGMTAKTWTSTGAAVGTRLVGGNASGAPVSGTFLLGDFVVNSDGSMFVCTSAGTPGTWSAVGAGPPVADATLNGLLAWTFDDVCCDVSGGTGVTIGSGTLYLEKVEVPVARSVTSIVARIVTAGSGLTGGENFAGIYNLAGTRLGTTADQTTPWASAGSITMAISGGPILLPAATYYIAILVNGTTPPVWMGKGASGNDRFNNPPSVSQKRFSQGPASQITLPSTIASIGGSDFGITAVWAGLI